MADALPATSAPSGSLPRRSRIASLFGDVRTGEGATVLLMLANLSLLLVGYYVVKTVREPLVLVDGGAEMKSYAAGGQALALMAFIPLYGWLASQVDRIRLITWVVLFFVACLELFNLGLRLAVPGLGFIFFVWVGVFNLATVAQFWSFANDLYRREVGERLFPLIAIGATAGSLLGAALASGLFSAGTSSANMLHITTIILLVHLAIYHLVQRREAKSAPSPAHEAPLAGPGGFRLVFSSSPEPRGGGGMSAASPARTSCSSSPGSSSPGSFCGRTTSSSAGRGPRKNTPRGSHRRC